MEVSRFRGFEVSRPLPISIVPFTKTNDRMFVNLVMMIRGGKKEAMWQDDG